MRATFRVCWHWSTQASALVFSGNHLGWVLPVLALVLPGVVCLTQLELPEEEGTSTEELPLIRLT